jgi:hypothetical protein
MQKHERPNQGTGGRFKRLASKLKGRDQPPPNPTDSDASSQSQPINADYNDRERAQRRYEKAATQLKDAIKSQKGPGNSSFDFSDDAEDFDDVQFKNKINAMLISREKSVKDRNGWAKFRNIVECVFTAFSPFAKNFLIVAQEAQSVIPFLFILIVRFL